MTRTVMTVLLFPLLALSSCGSTSRTNHLVAAPVPATEAEPVFIPEDVRHDPAARASLMEQLRVQILQKTRAVPERNRLLVREQLRRQLNRAGFDFEEVAYILSDLDRPSDLPGANPRGAEVDVARSPGGPESSGRSVNSR
jgi:hypothetical protein